MKIRGETCSFFPSDWFVRSVVRFDFVILKGSITEEVCQTKKLRFKNEAGILTEHASYVNFRQWPFRTTISYIIIGLYAYLEKLCHSSHS